MSDVERFTMLLGRVGVGIPRGVLDDDVRSLAAMHAGGGGSANASLRISVATAYWARFRAPIGAALAQADVDSTDPTYRDALELVESDDPANPLAQALVDDAVSTLAGVMARVADRLAVLDRRLESEDAGDELTRGVGAIVVDLLDLDVEDYEDEIAEYVRDGGTDGGQRTLARDSGDEQMREWAREELRRTMSTHSGPAAQALGAVASREVPEDAAEDPVWLATILALVDEALEIAVADQIMDPDGAGAE